MNSQIMYAYVCTFIHIIRYVVYILCMYVYVGISEMTHSQSNIELHNSATHIYH